MIVCESIEYLDALAADVGRSCIQLDLFSLLNTFVTVTQANQILALEAGIYAIMISYVWIVKGSKKNRRLRRNKMGLKNVEIMPTTQVVENKGKVSLFTRVSVGLGSLMVIGAANAAEGDPADFIAILTTKIQGVATGINTLYGVAILVVAAIITWGILKRGANKV